MSDKKNIGTWKVYTYPMDANPHIHVEGTVPTNGQKPIFELSVADPQGFVEEILILDLSPDAVDPDGTTEAKVEDFKHSTGGKPYHSVTIRAGSRDLANVPIEERTR